MLHMHDRTCRGMWELGQAALHAAYNGSPGMTLTDVAAGSNGIAALWALFAAEAPALLALAWYLEQVADSGVGVRRHWLFPLHSLGHWSGPPLH